MYDEEYIDSVLIFSTQEKRFLLPKVQLKYLRQNWQNTLEEVANSSSAQTLHNPVCVSVEPDGILLLG